MFFPLKVEMEREVRPIGTWVLIGVNSVVFAAMLLLSDTTRTALLYRFGFTPETWSVMTLLTHMFLHAGWLHILGNMYFLWIFGPAVESELGTTRYLGVYIGSGLIAALTHATVTAAAGADVPCVGASGAISGILGAMLALLPVASVRCALTISMHPHILSVPAWVFTGVWMLLQFISQKYASDPLNGSGVAYAAHIGGFAFGWFATSAGRLVRDIAVEWKAASLLARQDRILVSGVAGQSDPIAGKLDTRTQQMVFVGHGITPSTPGIVSKWIDGVSPERWMDAATFFLRMHLAGRETELDASAEVKGAKALADLGHVNCAVSCLMDRLEESEGSDRQQVYIGLAGILQQDEATLPAARHCLHAAVETDPSSWHGRAAQEALTHLSGPPA